MLTHTSIMKESLLNNATSSPCATCHTRRLFSSVFQPTTLPGESACSRAAHVALRSLGPEDGARRLHPARAGRPRTDGALNTESGRSAHFGSFFAKALTKLSVLAAAQAAPCAPVEGVFLHHLHGLVHEAELLADSRRRLLEVQRVPRGSISGKMLQDTHVAQIPTEQTTIF